MDEGGSITTSGCVFDGIGVLSRTSPETGGSSRTVDAVDCDEVADPRGTGVGDLSVIIGKSSESSFGDDLSSMANGVSGMGGGEGQRPCSFSSNQRFPRRSVTFEATGVGGSTLKVRLSSAIRSACWGAPPRLTLNLEVLFLTLGGGSEETFRSAV